MKRRLKILLYFLIAMIVITVGIFDFPLVTNYLASRYEGKTAQSGVIDLSGKDIDNGDYVYLSGEWEFFWHKFIVTDNISEAQPDFNIKVPSYWSDYSVNTTQLNKGGYAIYRLGLKNINTLKPFIVFVPNLPVAYRVFVDGQLIFQSGEISKTYDETKAVPSFTAYPITLNTNEMPGNRAELVIEVSCQFSGGITLTPVLVNYDTYSLNAIFMLALRYVFVGIIMLVGVFAFLMSKKIKGDNSYSAWLSLLCLFLIIRILISNEGFTASRILFSGFTVELMYFLIYVSTFINKLLLFIYTSKSLSLKLPQSLILIFGVFFLVYAAVPILFTSSIFDPSSFILLQMSTFIFDLYILYHLCAAIADKARNALLYTIGYITVLIGTYVDVLYVNGFINARVSWFMPLMFVFFVVTAIYINVLLMVDSYHKSSKAAELSKELSEINMSLMLSQIQPHFLYNALNTIKYLTKKNPKTAETAIVDFSQFLRANMDSLSKKEPVPFEVELNHIKNYVNIEMLRFEDRLNIVYDIRCKSFKLPALTIQPLVENAIKHGVNQKASGGTVTISSFEDKKNFYVSVADDGVGYDLESLPENGRSHIGLANITSRLKSMINADISIKSRLGYGTTVLITIPKNDKSVLREDGLK